MRTSSLALLLGLTLIGCVGEVDVSSGPGTGNGSGSGSGSGSGRGSGSGSNSVPDPAIAASVDKPTIASELLSTNQITVTVTGSNGFEGDATITATAVDAANAPIADWTVTLMNSTVTMTTDGTATAVAILKIPSDSTALTGKVKFAITAGTLTSTAESDVTATNQVTLNVVNTGGNCTYPATKATTVHVGTAIRWMNDMSSDTNMTVHVGTNPGVSGMKHEQDAKAPGTAYVQTPTGTGNTDWYCHNENDPGNLSVTVVQ